MLTLEMIGLRLKLARESLKLNQQQVVDLLISHNIQMSRETLSKIENGNRSISAVELKVLCEILNQNINEILQEDEIPSLVTLFRSKKHIEDETTLSKIAEIQDIITHFVDQKKLFKEGYSKNSVPLWRNC